MCKKIGVNFKEYDDCSKCWCGDCDKTERDKRTWVNVRKGNRLINKYDPYFIELSNTYSLLADFSANPSQADKPTSTEIQFKISSAKRRHKRENDKIGKYIFANKNNDEEIIN